MTSLAGRLRAAGLLEPSYGPDSITATLPEVAGSLGVDLPGATRSWDLPDARAVVLVLIDGLAAVNLADAARTAPFLARASGRTLRTGFPATTATSLSALGTASGPGLTGIVGYTARNPATGDLATLVNWRGAGDPAQWQRQPHLLAELAGSVDVSRIGPAKFAESGLTRAALNGGRYLAAETLAERVDAAIWEAHGRSITYLYWAELDASGHTSGVESPDWNAQLAAVDAEVQRLVRGVPRGTLVLLLSDHGMINATGRTDLASRPDLAAGVDLVGGEPRALHLYTRTPHEVADRWTAGTDAVVATRDEAVDGGLFGPVAPHVRPLIGDVVVAMRGTDIVVDSRTATPALLALKGHHGSLTPTEATVPLLVWA